jgi:hypothetical protein
MNFNPKDQMLSNLVEAITMLIYSIYIFNSSNQSNSLHRFNVCYFEIPDTEAFELNSSYDDSEI